jgi:hypothetical protein
VLKCSLEFSVIGEIDVIGYFFAVINAHVVYLIELVCLNSLPVKAGFTAATEYFKGALFTNCIRPNENPVLPR